LSRKRVLVVVTTRGDAEGFPDALVATAQDYIEAASVDHADALILNLCRTLGYGSDGYYVSLLADARGQQVLPRLETSAGLAEPYSRFRALQEAGVPTLDAAEMAARRRTAGFTTDAEAETETDVQVWGPWPLVREGTTLREAREDEVQDVVACLGATADPRFARDRDERLPRLAGAAAADPCRTRGRRVEGGRRHARGAGRTRPRTAQTLIVHTVTGGMRALRRGAGPAQRDTVRASIAVLLDSSDPFSASSDETIDRLERVAAG
jgi:hypothetical protein